ncbi:MAG: hypothetical protein R2873_21325 [Caldilineaceae bacterium]
MSEDEQARRLRLVRAVYQDDCEVYDDVLSEYAAANEQQRTASHFAAFEAHLAGVKSAKRCWRRWWICKTWSATAPWIEPGTIPDIEPPWSAPQAQPTTPEKGHVASSIRAWTEQIADALRLIIDLGTLGGVVPTFASRGSNDETEPLHEHLLTAAELGSHSNWSYA